MPSEQVPAESRRARIRFLTPEEGGRQIAPASGVRSQIEVGEFQTSCVVESDAGLELLPLGEEMDVRIRVMFPEAAGPAFAKLAVVELFEGNRRVATGQFLDEPRSNESSG
ncbi:hypothetical protein GCM10009747_04770 [Agromyces humatus]|uniref:PilZ domain-containing protein n=1 Tax=Agromyces humatus TaxID=279573 RepID=A0ABN2KA96_9MICO